MDHAKTLRSLLEQDAIVCAPGAPDALAARLAVVTGWEAECNTGYHWRV